MRGETRSLEQCDELKLILELDGSVHLKSNQKEKDKKREDYLKSEGYGIIRFENYIIINRPEILFQKFKMYLILPLLVGEGRGEGWKADFIYI
ncbi:MAG: DUF559 domain-containing protein [Spirochaetaceae bacterium]|nr:DUF559 domain-containing protein [Spirochaetaceae bacterium]